MLILLISFFVSIIVCAYVYFVVCFFFVVLYFDTVGWVF